MRPARVRNLEIIEGELRILVPLSCRPFNVLMADGVADKPG